MNIDGDYLWDKTGEPDPEIQELEEILGTLRYQARPLKIPADLQPNPTRGFFSTPRLAIAATLAMALLGLGLWLGVQRWQQRRSPVVAESPIAPASGKNPGSRELPTPDEGGKNTAVATFGVPEQKDKDLSRRMASAKLNFAQKKTQNINPREPVHNQHKIG